MEAAALNAALEGMGIRVRPEWLETCLAQLPPPPPGAWPQQEQWVLAQVYEQFLHSDLNALGRGGGFPPGLSGVPEHTIQDTHVLQVDAIKNISQPAETRGKAVSPGTGRCLLLALSDGVQRAVGMEYAPIPDLRVEMPPGVKVAVHRCRVKEGVLLLTKETVQVLGGHNSQPLPQSQQSQQPPSPGLGGPQHQQRQQQQQPRGAQGQGQQQQQQRHAPPPGPAAAGARGAGGAATTADPYDDPGIDWDAIPDYTTARHNLQPPALQQQPPPPALILTQEREREVEEAMRAAAAAMDDAWVYGADEEAMAEAEAEAAVAAAAAGAFNSKKRPRPSSPLTGRTGCTTGATAASPAGRVCTGRNSSPAASSVILVPSQSQCSTQASASAAAALSGSAPASGALLPPLSSLRDEAVEGPFVRLCEWRRFPGQTVRVRGVAVRTVGAQTTKKVPLRVIVDVDDGSNELMRARLSNALLERVVGMTPTAFRALLDQDRAAATRALDGIALAVYKLEGVLTLRLPTSTAPVPSSAPSQGQQQQQPPPPPQPPTAVLLSCEDPSWYDVRALINVCSGARPGSGESGMSAKEVDFIVLSGGD